MVVVIGHWQFSKITRCHWIIWCCIRYDVFSTSDSYTLSSRHHKYCGLLLMLQLQEGILP